MVIAVAVTSLYLVQSQLAPDPEEAPTAGEVQVDEGPQEAEPEPPAPSDLEARRAERDAARTTATLRGERFEVEVDNLSGGIRHFRLLGDDRFQTDEGEPLDLITTDRDEYASFRLSLPGAAIRRPEIGPHSAAAELADPIWDLEQVSEREVRMTWEGAGVRVERNLRVGEGPYQLWSWVEVTNTSGATRPVHPELHAFHYVTKAEAEGFFSLPFLPNLSRSPQISSGVCALDGAVVRKDGQGLVETPHAYGVAPHPYGAEELDFAALENLFFVQAMLPSGETAASRCGMLASERGNPVVGTLFESRLVYPTVELAPGGSATWQTLAYLGPKDPDALAAAGHDLNQVVNLGWFAVIARQLAKLLSLIQDLVGNWGLAIILLTVLVRLAMFPLTEHSFRSMAKMRQLKPELDVLNEKYGDDREAKMRATMELYRKHGMGPAKQLSGCLPQLLQMPIFIALYASLSSNIELYHMPFALWWTDLTAPDPYFALPLMLGGLMHLQQRLSPMALDPAQARMMMWMMPVMITVFMLFMPSGLCLYMLTNSVLGLGQQKMNELRVHRESLAREAEQDDDSDASDDASNANPSSPTPSRRPRRGGRRQRRTRRGRA
ncbi:MAG: YidC/Oxa1 family insertase periplasmic-domain containing protein [Sandaracinaceae bacterium]